MDLTILPLAAICHFFLLQWVKRSLTSLGVQSREQKPPLPCHQGQPTPALMSPANGSAPASTCFKDMVHVPLFNTAQLLPPSKSWITSELGELPQGPWDKLAWHQAPVGLSSSYCHCHLGTFPVATKALGPRRTTVKSQEISATELLRIWINPHTLLDFVTLLSAIVTSKPCNC